MRAWSWIAFSSWMAVLLSDIALDALDLPRALGDNLPLLLVIPTIAAEELGKALVDRPGGLRASDRDAWLALSPEQRQPVADRGRALAFFLATELNLSVLGIVWAQALLPGADTAPMWLLVPAVLLGTLWLGVRRLRAEADRLMESAHAAKAP